MRITRTVVDSVLDSFGLPASRRVVRLGGWANKNLLVITQDAHEYVLKVLVLQQSEMLANDIAIQQQLRAAGIASPLYRTNMQGARLYRSGALQAVISDRLQGSHPENMSDACCFEVGKTVGAFHAAVHRLPLAHAGWLNPQLATTALALRSRVAYIRRAQALIQANLHIFDAGLPTGIIHGDLHENNVLIESEQHPAVVAVMDFEEAEANLLLVDLARTILSVGRDSSGTALLHAPCSAVVAGYASVRALEPGERALLASAIRYVVGVEVLWLHRHGQRAAAAQHIQRAEHLPAIGTMP